MSTPVVLVHGGGHGSWCWERILPLLGSEALAIDLPPKSIRGVPGPAVASPDIAAVTLDDFADSAMADIDERGFDRFVLVGHSVGGLTIAEIARRHPDRVHSLIFVSCIVPREGESMIDDLAEQYRTSAREAVANGTSPVAQFDEAMVRDGFCNDMDEAATQFELAHFGTDTATPLGTVVTRKGIPADLRKTWVKLLQDRMLVPEEQDKMIRHLLASPGGAVDVVEIDAGHNVMISKPGELAAVIAACR